MSRIATPTTAAAVGALEGVLAVIVVVLGSLTPHYAGSTTTAVLVTSLLAVGLVVAYRAPSNRMGWLMLGGAGFLLLSGLGSTYSVLDYRDNHGALPLGPIAVLIDPSWAPAILMLVLGLVLYPEGRLPSRGWRWPVRGLLVLAAAWQFGAFGIAGNAILGGHIAVATNGDLRQVDNPTGAWAWWNVVQAMFFLSVMLTLLTWIASQAIGYRRLSGEARLQQKWLLGGAAITVVSFVLILPAVVGNGPGATPPLVQALSDIGTVGFAALPLAIGIGILKFRLYEIDRVISRSLSYAIVTALLVGTFVGLVVLTTRVLPFSSTVGVAASTLAAAALFNPLRVRVQRVVDRRFNRSRYDAEETVAAFAVRLRDAVDVDTVQADLLDVVQRAVQPSHSSVWIRSSAR
jgi:hypothetical protein